MGDELTEQARVSLRKILGGIELSQYFRIEIGGGICDGIPPDQIGVRLDFRMPPWSSYTEIPLERLKGDRFIDHLILSMFVQLVDSPDLVQKRWEEIRSELQKVVDKAKKDNIK